MRKTLGSLAQGALMGAIAIVVPAWADGGPPGVGSADGIVGDIAPDPEGDPVIRSTCSGAFTCQALPPIMAAAAADATVVPTAADKGAQFLTTRGDALIDPTGATSSTQGLARIVAAACNRTLVLLPGVYLTQEIPVACPVHLRLEPGATLRLIQPPTGANPFGLPGWSVLHFEPGSQGSLVDGGGTIDGNSRNLVGQYNTDSINPKDTSGTAGRYVRRYPWSGIHVEGVTGPVTLRDISFVNVLNQAVLVDRASGFTAEHIKVDRSSKVITVQDCNGCTVQHIVGTNIGNQVIDAGGAVRAVPVYQYGVEMRDVNRSHIDDIRIDGYAPLLCATTCGTGAADPIGDPMPSAFQFERMTDVTFGTFVASGATYSDARASNVMGAFSFSSLTQSSVQSVDASGFYYGLNIQGATRSTIQNANLDCDYNVAGAKGLAQGAGLRLRGFGFVEEVHAFGSVFDHYNTQPTEALDFGRVVATRCYVGAQLESGRLHFGSLAATANMNAGLLVWSTEPNNSFPKSAGPVVTDLTFDALEASYNGQAGVWSNDGSQVAVANAHADNNGQETSASNLASGILFNGSAARDGWRLADWTANDTQAELSLPRGFSFYPGATTAANGSNKIQVLAHSAQTLHRGQHVSVKNGTGSVDINGKIVDIDVTHDIVTLATSAPVTFSEAGNLVSLVGTVSVAAKANLLEGTRTRFTSAITGPVILKAGGQYFRVLRVNSDTELLVNHVSSPVGLDGDGASIEAITAAAAQLVQTDVVGIASQQIGLNLPSGSNVTDLSWGPWGSYQTTGNTLVGTAVAGSIGSLASGQEFLYESGTTTLSSQYTAVLPTIAAADAATLLPESYTFQVMSAVTGSGVTGLNLYANYGDTYPTFFDRLPIVKNTVARGIVAQTAWPATGETTFTLKAETGTPTTGRVRAGVLFRKIVPPAYSAAP